MSRLSVTNISTGVTFINPSSNPNIVRLAILPPDGQAGTGQLYQFDVSKTLLVVIEDICQKFNLTSAQTYGLQNQKTSKYVTEETMADLKDGVILQVTISPFLAVQRILESLKSQSPEEIKNGLEKLAGSSADPTFAKELIRQKGVDLLIQMVELGNENGRPLECILKAFLDLMENVLIDWESLTNKFLKRVASMVSRTEASEMDVIKIALSLLENVILNCAGHYNTIANEITFQFLRPHLDCKNHEVQQNCLALMNALCLKAPEDKKQRFEQNLSSREIRTVINEKVIRNPKIGTQMSHQLYVFQQLTFNLLERKCTMAVDASSTECQEIILDLRSNAFENAPEAKRHGQHMFSEDYKKLGFTNYGNPLMDFAEAPPGRLALDCMSHFANHHGDVYYQVVHENFSRGIEHECPFAKTSIALTKLLSEILRVGEIPGETGQEYHPMFFSVDKSFEEFFCWCIRLFSKTWKEMRATKEDFPKVLSVVKEQIELTLRKNPPTLDQFWNTLINDFTYTQIVELRQQERWNKEEWTSKASPVLQLREQIKPEIHELIKQQRLNYLVEGTRFNRVTKTGRLQDKYWYCRLSTNLKTLHSGDISDGEIPSVDSLSNKMSVSDIVQIQTGKECSFVKRSAESLAFTVSASNDQKLDFLAASQDVYDMWIDGLHLLLGTDMPSKQAQTDLDTLLGMEMSIRLLDTANIPIPEEAPIVPPPPSDYNFYYDN